MKVSIDVAAKFLLCFVLVCSPRHIITIDVRGMSYQELFGLLYFEKCGMLGDLQSLGLRLPEDVDYDFHLMCPMVAEGPVVRELCGSVLESPMPGQLGTRWA